MTQFHPGCENEQLHLIGHIQPNGFLLAGKAGDSVVHFASENCAEFTGSAATDLFGKDLADIIPDLQSLQGSQTMARKLLMETTVCDHGPFDAVYQTSERGWLLEVFPSRPETFGEEQVFSSQSRLLQTRLSMHDDVNLIYETLVTEIYDITGYDHIMLYQFLDDDSGEVIAEKIRGNEEAYLGLRFPASDIPQIARKLYSVNAFRSIADVDAEPAAILTESANEQLDLTYSDLRAVSPVHLEYLRNMNVGSSLSFSIMNKQQLWGLVACHATTPRDLPLGVKETCAAITHNFNVVLGTIIAEKQLQTIDLAEKQNDLIFELLNSDKDLSQQAAFSERLLDVMAANGFAYFDGTNWVTAGDTPADDIIAGIAEKTEEQIHNENIYYTDALGNEDEQYSGISDTASGVLYIRIRKLKEHDGLSPCFIWFRPELPQQINWAGNPYKTAEGDDVSEQQSIRPRNSFKLWQETTRGKSAPWSSLQVMVATRFRAYAMKLIAAT